MEFRIESQWGGLKRPNKYIQLIEIAYNQVRDLDEIRKTRFIFVLFGIVLIIDFK